MATTKEQKQQLIETYGKNAKDTGAIEVQLAITNSEIRLLTEHIKVHPKDNHNKRGLLAYIAKQKKLLKYLREQDYDRYKTIIQKLGIRK